MTEAEWLACEDPLLMISNVCVWERHTFHELGRFVGLLRPNNTERKYRLFACACARQAQGLFSDPHSRRAIELAELYADGKAEIRDLIATRIRIEPRAVGITKRDARLAACSVASAVAERGASLANTFRDIFGNPFRPVAFSPTWRTDTAVTLARQMYESREFSAMPILADALQDAECDSDDILSHCRDTSLTHVRGCWVTDLVLGKQ